MKAKIHPKYYVDARIICACGNTFTVGSTSPELKIDICSACHPFYTGEQRIVDTEGQVDRFYKKIEARKMYLADVEARETARTSLARPVAELDLSPRVTETLTKAGIENVGQVLDKMAAGEQTLLNIDGFGRKSLADLKKALRRFGYELPEAAEEIVV
jgi:large subunit ribosomal protein L31